MLTLISYSGAWSRHGSTLRQVTVTHSAFDNDECHVTAFRPISEAAHSWSYDNCGCYLMQVVLENTLSKISNTEA